MQKNEQNHKTITSIPATGFGSPGDDFYEDDIFYQLNEYLVPRPISTFYFRLRHRNFAPWALLGDILIVDRSLEPKRGHLVVALIEGEYMLGEISMGKEGVSFRTSPKISRVRFFPWDQPLEIFGVVSFILRDTKKKGAA